MIMRCMEHGAYEENHTVPKQSISLQQTIHHEGMAILPTSNLHVHVLIMLPLQCMCILIILTFSPNVLPSYPSKHKASIQLSPQTPGSQEFFKIVMFGHVNWQSSLPCLAIHSWIHQNICLSDLLLSVVFPNPKIEINLVKLRLMYLVYMKIAAKGMQNMPIYLHFNTFV